MSTDWVKPLHSKTAVKRAGRLIGEGTASEAEITEATAIVSNFRSAHAYPLLSVTVHATTRARTINPDAVVARRLKRLPTIIDKLNRHPNMNVATMQDLGGCRVVLKSTEEVLALVEDLKTRNRARNDIIRSYDYLRGGKDDHQSGPKSSGYRGHHLVYRYQASKEEFVGLQIEVQIRTELQHAWATAVETMDLFSQSEIKYGRADADLQRFFTVASSLMALQEGMTPVPGAEDEAASLARELAHLNSDLRVVERLSDYTAIVDRHSVTDRRNSLTLELRRSRAELNVRVHESASRAAERLAELEALQDDDLDVVLVNIAKIGQLRSAYPNYFADTEIFRHFVTSAISG